MREGGEDLAGGGKRVRGNQPFPEGRTGDGLGQEKRTDPPPLSPLRPSGHTRGYGREKENGEGGGTKERGRIITRTPLPADRKGDRTNSAIGRVLALFHP